MIVLPNECYWREEKIVNVTHIHECPHEVPTKGFCHF
jgi:hypothetical protein